MSASTGGDLQGCVAPLNLDHEYSEKSTYDEKIMRHEDLMSPVSPDGGSGHDVSRKEQAYGLESGCVFIKADAEDVSEYLGFLKETSAECFRFPVLCLSDYGNDGDYASDIWVLLHNTVRRELLDLYEMINCMRQLKLLLNISDVYNFRRWWRFFSVVWDGYVMHNNVCLQPIVKQICLANWEDAWMRKELRKLNEDSDWLSLKMVEVSSYIEEFEKFEPGKVLRLFMQTMDDLTCRILSHFSEREKLLPPLVRKYFGKQIKTAVEGQLVSRFRKSEHFGELLVCVLRTIDTSQGMRSPTNGVVQRNKWIEEHLNWIERMRMSYYVHKFNANHGSIVNEFKERRCFYHAG